MPTQTGKPRPLREKKPGDGPPVRRVLILIERAIGYRHSVLRGIFSYAQHVGTWVCQGSNLDAEAVDALMRMRPRPDGVIAGLDDLPLARRLAKSLRTPLVDVYDWFEQPWSKFQRVSVDNRAIGVVAANHLVARGFRHAAFFGHSSLYFSVERRHGFESVMKEHGVDVQSAPHVCSDIDVWRHTRPLPREALAEWVRALPKPTAVFCASDAWGLALSDICHTLGLEVPHQVAILGVDNDELLCSLSRPPLSSVDTDADRVGYQAAALLDRLMSGQTGLAARVLIPPGEVVERQSTNVLQIDDADVAMALRFIRGNAHRQIRISDVTDHVVIRRRTLQRRFRETVGHGLSEEVARCRVELAKRLLAETDLSVPQVAQRCGFRYRERLWGAFRRLAGSSPVDYRRRFRNDVE